MKDHYLFTVVKLNILNRDIVFYIRISYLNLRDKQTLNNQVSLFIKNRDYLYERIMCYRKNRRGKLKVWICYRAC